DRHRSRAHSGAHHRLQGPRGGGLRHAARHPRPDARERARPRARERDRDARAHRVPMSFGTVFRTPQDIVELLRSAYTAFNDVLIKMENKVEFGLKILWEPDSVLRGIEAQDENLRRLKQEISSQRGSTYFARMQYGRLVDSLLQERSAELVA